MSFDARAEPALLEWLSRACVDIDVESVMNGYGVDVGYQVVVHSDMPGEGREGAVIATCDGQDEAELVAAALWALARRWTTDE